MADQVHEVGGIFAIVNRKGAIQADIVSTLPKEASADSVEGARPERVGHRSALIPERLCGDALNPPLHLDSGTSREGQQHHPPRIGARGDQMILRFAAPWVRSAPHEGRALRHPV